MVVGIVCEYNPFHLGHKYQIDKIKEKYPDSTIVIVVSSCFTQRGELSIMNKWDKTKVALENGVDLVVELPFVYATQSADIFAKGAIEILNKVGIDTLVFGIENDNLDVIEKMVDIQLNNSEYDKLVKEYMNDGINYPTAMSKALNKFIDYKISLPNELLALSYIKEIRKNNYNIKPIGIKRTNDYHGKVIKDNIVNASLIRKLLRDDDDISNFINYDDSLLYKKIDEKLLFDMLKYQIINNIDRLDKFMTVDEGIENRIRKVIMNVNSWDDLVKEIKTKRYTYNKINRMLVHILCNLKKEDIKKIDIDYIRILGFSDKGKNYLNRIKKDIDVKIVNHYKKEISYLLDIEYRITCIYDMIMKSNLSSDEFRKGPIIL